MDNKSKSSNGKGKKENNNYTAVDQSQKTSVDEIRNGTAQPATSTGQSV